MQSMAYGTNVWTHCLWIRFGTSALLRRTCSTHALLDDVRLFFLCAWIRLDVEYSDGFEALEHLRAVLDSAWKMPSGPWGQCWEVAFERKVFPRNAGKASCAGVRRWDHSMPDCLSRLEVFFKNWYCIGMYSSSMYCSSEDEPHFFSGCNVGN